MKLPPVEYRRAQDAADAVTLLGEFGEDAKVLAGGQSLVPLMSFRLARPTVLVDLNPVQGLDFVRAEDGHLVVGAMTRQRTVERHAGAHAAVPLLPLVLPHIGHATNRNRGTIGGSIAHADPAAELPTLAQTLAAEMVVLGPRGERTVPASEFFLGPLTPSLDYDEVLTSVRFPRLPDGTGAGVAELARRHGDFAVVSVLAAVHVGADGWIDHVRLGASGVASVPLRLHAAEAVLLGTSGDAAAIEAAAEAAVGEIDPVDDVHGPADYRRHVTRVMLGRAVRDAVRRAEGSAHV